uniref:Leucoanthocyanidin dioxygenase n=1 Tax=Lycoris radiata TaxID=228395 RepID=A0A1P7XN97_LYCRD|nr:leucoanthocyanidin dioxygenase [Lycoris radiata]
MGEEETTELKLKLVQELAKSGCGPSDRYTQREEDRPISSCFLPSSSSFPQVPIVNLHRLFNGDDDEAHKLGSAVQSWGLFQAIGHDLSPSFLDEVQDVSRKFFQLPLEVKQKYSNLKSGKFELEGYGNDHVATKEQIIDWNDRLYLLVQPEDKRKLEWWPENPSSFREILHEYTMKTRKIADLILLALAKLLKLDENYFVNELGDEAEVFARFTYYPSCSRPDLVFGIKPHSDSSVMTILLLDEEVDGLQVLKDGKWVKVPSIPHALLINLGNQMEIMSNGIFKSPVHRVVANSKERISIAMFYSLEPEKILEPSEHLVSESRPSLYNKMTVKDFLIAFFEKFSHGVCTIEWLKV